MNDIPERLLRRREVEEMTGLGTTSIYKFMNQGRFPQPVRLTARSVRWRLSEINAWIAEQTSEPKAAAA